MIPDNTPHRIFRISELTRLIASQLVLTSPEGAVSLACACRYLNEPVLSTLWETQVWLVILLKVLPEENYQWNDLASGESVFRIVGDPSPAEWKRVHRYASWMHELRFRIDGKPAFVDTFSKLRLNSPAGGWFPALQDLTWCITETNHPYADLFFSPHLKRIFIYSSLPWSGSEIPRDILPAISSVISSLPTSSLQSLSVSGAVPWADLTDSLSSVVLRCGPPLTKFSSRIPLSDAAVNHLMRLPHLQTWYIHHPPPSYSAPSFPPILPPLTDLTLGGGAVSGWISLFERSEQGASATQGATPLSKMKESLGSLDIENSPNPTIDAPFASTIQKFRNLVTLSVQFNCHDADDEAQCAFKLNNDDVNKLAMALPQLEWLLLGYPCSENTCATTIACLLLISVHCVKLEWLKIHFNTTNIVDDLKDVSVNPRFEDLRSLPRGLLSQLGVWQMPLSIDEPDVEAVVNGILAIFPSLESCAPAPYNPDWDGVSGRIEELREV